VPFDPDQVISIIFGVLCIRRQHGRYSARSKTMSHLRHRNGARI